MLGGLAAAASTHAGTIVFDFGSAHDAIGSSHTYTVGGLSIIATGYDNTGALTGLFGKHNGGDEIGLGLVNDPTHDDEIHYGKGFIQLDVRDLIGKVRPGSTFFATNSTTHGEEWGVFGSNQSDHYGSTPLLTGGIETLQALPGFGQYKYYDFVELNQTPKQGDNFLIHSLQTSAAPEPAAWATMLLGFSALGGLMRHRRSMRALVAARTPFKRC